MSIVMMCEKNDPGAVLSEYWSKVANRDTYLQTTCVGHVLFLTERNWHDDSDFMATVWDDATNSPKQIEYASTRGWTYPNGAAVDATPEVLAKYHAWQQEQIRREMVQFRWNVRRNRRKTAVLCNITTEQYDKLAALYNNETLARVSKLLSSKLRSGFRIKMRTQILEWLADPSPKYPTPLSYKQLEYV